MNASLFKYSTFNCLQARMCLLFSLLLYMPMSEVDMKLQKLYYSMGDVSEMFEVNASLIRFWEKEFSIIKPKKNKKGNRLFTQKDIKNFDIIYRLVKIEGYTLEGAKQQLKRSKQSLNEPKQDDVLSLLEEIKKELLLVKEAL